MPSVKPDAARPVVRQESKPPSSVRPVSVPPRPRSSLPSPEIPSGIVEHSRVEPPASPVLAQAAPKPATVPGPEAAPAIDVVSPVDVPATEAPAAVVATNTFEASPSAPSITTEWREAAPDTLRPSHVDLPSALSRRALRVPARRTLLVAAIVALAGVIGWVASSTRSEPDTVAALPPAAPTLQPPPAPAAPQAAARPPSTAAPATSGHPSGLVESAKSALYGAENSVLVTVHVTPPNAVVFKHGLRFGTGTVTLKVARGTKTTLFARLDGYVPRTFVVDGEHSSVNIALSRRQWARVTGARPVRAQAATSPESEQDKATPARADEPSEGASNTADTAAAGTAGSDPMGDVNPY
jgi:hypothetical protein